jgi:UDPglucose--hexose-1-phosphate uridylyltransferase
VVPNLFPVVSDPQRGAGAVGNRFFQSKRAAGVHEVVIETPIHNQELTTRHPALVNLMLKTWRRRLIALMSRPEIQHVVVFKNKGRDAGNSLDHPHSQIVGLNFVPAEVRRRVQTARRFHRRSGNCLVCEAVNEERRAGARVVYEADRLLAFEPFAAGWVGETLLVPLNHSASYTAAADDQLEALGEGIVRVLQGTAESYDDPPFNLVLHTAPKPYASDRALHWYVQLIPRLGQWGGFELGTGVRINPIAPKGVAQDLWTTRMPVPRGSRRRRVR